MARVMATNEALSEAPVPDAINSQAQTDTYVRMTRLIERLHRRHLDILRFELDRLGVDGISAAQALMLTKIQGQTIGVRELVERGCYLGANASYNIKQMVACDLIAQERSPHDHRAVRLKLTEKGETLCNQIAEAEKIHAAALTKDLGNLGEVDNACTVLKSLETTWSNYLRYGDH
jgi:DNA-binding MarR family transcriptional regulator